MATLEELDGEDWGEPTYPSHLVTTCHLLRRKQVDDLTVEDLRVLIGQGIGLPHLLPRVLAALNEDVFAEGDFYPGDLLSALMREANWPELISEKERISGICDRALSRLRSREDD